MPELDEDRFDRARALGPGPLDFQPPVVGTHVTQAVSERTLFVEDIEDAVADQLLHAAKDGPAIITVNELGV